MAQGDYGTPSNRVNITSERWTYTPHTSDPQNTEKGDEWLRVDMDSGDKIATLRFEYNSSGNVWDIPVFPVGSSEDPVQEVMRVGTPNGEGYIPAMDVSQYNPLYDKRRYQSGGTKYGFHSLQTELPRGVVDNYEAADADPPGVYESGETIADYYSGSTGSWTRTTSDVVEGGHALAVTTESTGEFIFSTPDDGLNQYPNEGDTVAFLIRNSEDGSGLNGVIPYLATNAASGPDSYLHQFDPVNGQQIAIAKLNDGSFSELASASITESNDTWYWGEADLPTTEDATITFTLYEANTGGDPPTRGSEIQSVSTTDSDFVTNQGVGARRGSSDQTGTVLDWIRVL